MPSVPKSILLLATTASEAVRYIEVAQKLGLEAILGTEDSSGPILLDFATRDSALQVVQFAEAKPIVAVIAIGERPVPCAARAASMLGLLFHPPKAADACTDKTLLRERLQAAGLKLGEKTGDEISVEALMDTGGLRVLAILERDGKVGSAQLNPALRKQILKTLVAAIKAVGLKHGPVHAVFCTGNEGLWLTDLAASATVDTWARALRLRIPLVDDNVSLEELVVRHALGMDVSRIYSTNR